MKNIIKIQISYKNESAKEDAINEVIRQIREGFTSGFNSNEESSYSFEVK